MRWRNPFKKKSAITDYSEIWRELLGQARSKSGISINYKTVLQLTTAQACARVIAEDIAQLPKKIYKSRQDGGSDAAINHPIYNLIKSKPNDWQTSFEMFEQIGLHLVLTNNAYVWINRVRGQIVELLPLEPHRVNVKRVGWESSYEIQLDGNEQIILTKDDIWHIRGPSWNGWCGLDGVRLMREAVGLAVSLEEHGSRMFSNGATVGGLLSTEANLSEDQVKRLRDSWTDRQAGSANAYKTAVMWGGMKWAPMATPNDAAQFLETRKFQVSEVCRAFKVMPLMVGHSDTTTTFASAEQMRLVHLINTMNPWLTRIEQSADCNLLTEKERNAGFYVKFSRNALLSMLASDRASYYSTLYNIGVISPNEARGFEDMNPYDGGDQYRVPLNMENPNANTTP